MHDPTALMRFKQNDIYLPIITLEELDNNKKGLSEVARNSRMVSRVLDRLTEGCVSEISNSTQFAEGFPLNPDQSKQSGRLFLQTSRDAGDTSIYEFIPGEKNDNQIIAMTLGMKKKWEGVHYSEVILVSKDINVRVKARACGIIAEDYENDKVVDDASLLWSGITQIEPFHFHEKSQCGNEDAATADMHMFRIPIIPDTKFYPNQLIHDGNGFNAIVRGFENDEMFIQRPRNYEKKHHVLGISARNREQNFILNLLLDPKISIVTLLGPAGSGKTLLTVVSALKQSHAAQFGEGLYQNLIMTRITVPIGEDIGFLPGTEEEKMAPWMGALSDNLQIIARSYNATLEKESFRNTPRLKSQAVRDRDEAVSGKAMEISELRKHFHLPSISTMRGRTFVDSFVIIDEAQNLTPDVVKTLATRVGTGSKMVFLGNLAQIDTPYLTDTSSGLAYLAERFKGQSCYGHAILSHVVRSEVAQLAEELL